jgi:anti-sigma factor RsiW
MRPRWTRPAPCRHTLRELQSYLDGEADVDTAWRVARHLSRCEDCFGDADTIREIQDALASLRVAPDGQALARLRSLLSALTDPGPEASRGS